MSVLLVCSGGGHLKQLSQLIDRTPFADQDRLWVTFDTGLSRSLLAGQEVVYASYAAPRDMGGVARNAVLAAKVVGARRFDHAISTGANLAVDFLPLARLRGTQCHYVESAARAEGPSLTGKIMERTPGVTTYTQYQHWAGPRWSYVGSVFDAYAPGPRREVGAVRSAVVTLGTNESYPFRRVLERLVALFAQIGVDPADVLWQTGTTDVQGLGIDGRASVEHDELRAAVAEADVVVTHSGTGSAVTALELGRMPLLVPRRVEHGEHIDDHQVQIAAELARRGLAVQCAVEDLDAAALLQAAGGSTVGVPDPPALAITVR